MLGAWDPFRSTDPEMVMEEWYVKGISVSETADIVFGNGVYVFVAIIRWL